MSPTFFTQVLSRSLLDRGELADKGVAVQFSVCSRLVEPFVQGLLAGLVLQFEAALVFFEKLAKVFGCVEEADPLFVV